MTASLLLKLVIGITVLLVVCIPECFKTQEGILVNLLCTDPCMMDLSSICWAMITPLKCLLQENKTKEEIIKTAVAQNAVLSSITLDFYINNSVFICCPQRNTHPLSQGMNAQGMPINVKLNIRGKYFHYSEVESNFVMACSQEDKNLSVPFSLEIHIRNLTGHNETIDQLPYEDLGVHHDFMNVSLHFESQIPFYTRPLGIIWLILISLVFVCGLIFIVYKVKQGEKTAPLIYYNKESSNIPRLKEHNNVSKKVCDKKNDHMCRQEGLKNQNFYSNPIIPIVVVQQGTVYK
ncbi:hypothetical protein PRIEUP_LOCUS16455 [Pristimantis euphronides]